MNASSSDSSRWGEGGGRLNFGPAKKKKKLLFGGGLCHHYDAAVHGKEGKPPTKPLKGKRKAPRLPEVRQPRWPPIYEKKKEKGGSTVGVQRGGKKGGESWAPTAAVAVALATMTLLFEGKREEREGTTFWLILRGKEKRGPSPLCLQRPELRSRSSPGQLSSREQGKKKGGGRKSPATSDGERLRRKKKKEKESMPDYRSTRRHPNSSPTRALAQAKEEKRRGHRRFAIVSAIKKEGKRKGTNDHPRSRAPSRSSVSSPAAREKRKKKKKREGR